MAKIVLKDASITVNSVDLSDHVDSVEVMLSKDEIDTTNFGGDGRERKAGLKDDSITLNFHQDFGTASVDATLYPLWDNETEFSATVVPSTATVSATNPSYSGTFVLLEYQPLNGSVGDLSETSVTLFAQRSGITRATA